MLKKKADILQKSLAAEVSHLLSWRYAGRFCKIDFPQTCICEHNTLLQNIRVVLVNTSHPGNIGGAARAMKNMGLSRLVLVQPKEFPCAEASARARVPTTSWPVPRWSAA
jgi:rRNA methylase